LGLAPARRAFFESVLVNIVKITEDPENKRLSNLIKQYADVALESTSLAELSDARSSPE